jgi:tetrapyrrole methylase family protein/MazG family protein
MNFSWIIDNELMISSAPESNTMLRALKNAGIKAVVCATENPFPVEAYNQLGMEVLDFPLVNNNPPPLEDLKRFAQWTSLMAQAKQPMMFFCQQGFDRAGLLAACYLIIHKHFSSRDALKEIREIRGDEAIASAKFQEFLIDCEYVRPLLVDIKDQAFFNAVMITDILRRRCPWDREQTPESMLPNMLEETYETWEAILKKDDKNIASELGDVLLQVLMISRMKSESAKFDIETVISAMTEKLIKRHPHVFADSDTDTPDTVLKQWRSLKDSEIGSISDIPSSIPAFGRAERIMSFAKKRGFDWPKIDGVIDKTHEELKELKHSAEFESHDKVEEEFGDVMFVLLNLARFLKVNPELSLHKTLDKFTSRFSKIEEKSRLLGMPIEKLTLEQMDEIWNQAKKHE